jgi:hypothetical protein
LRILHLLHILGEELIDTVWDSKNVSFSNRKIWKVSQEFIWGAVEAMLEAYTGIPLTM